jgi:hypothetical protein
MKFQTIRDFMNTFPQVRSLNARIDGVRRYAAGVASPIRRNFLNLDYPAPLWLDQAIGFRDDDLEMKHWQKIMRSLLED